MCCDLKHLAENAAILVLRNPLVGKGYWMLLYQELLPGASRHVSAR